jgi:hypothetical protein
MWICDVICASTLHVGSPHFPTFDHLTAREPFNDPVFLMGNVCVTGRYGKRRYLGWSDLYIPRFQSSSMAMHDLNSTCCQVNLVPEKKKTCGQQEGTLTSVDLGRWIGYFLATEVAYGKIHLAQRLTDLSRFRNAIDLEVSSLSSWAMAAMGPW